MAETRMELKRERRSDSEIVMTFRKIVIGDIIDKSIIVTVDSGTEYFEVEVPGELANDAFEHPFAYKSSKYCNFAATAAA